MFVGDSFRFFNGGFSPPLVFLTEKGAVSEVCQGVHVYVGKLRVGSYLTCGVAGNKLGLIIRIALINFFDAESKSYQVTFCVLHSSAFLSLVILDNFVILNSIKIKFI